MKRRTELLQLLSSNNHPDSTTVYYWITLLNFYETHKTELDIVDLRLLVVDCEECREAFNDSNPTDPIRQEDTNPNIYVQLEKLESNAILNNNYRNNNNTESLSTDLVAIAQ